ncbi:MAG TPA: hypothetical protein ENN29_12910 [Candidatus Hydrogenedentes bacterium]|nr:hypothetical protein [Candidatus Hydrogenedentota bacterium]
MQNIANLTLAVAVALCGCVTAPVWAQHVPATTEMLVDDLTSAEDARQARARQMLPLRGAEAAAKMAALLDDERDAVYFAALRVLEDVIHETNRRGANNDCEVVTDVVFSLLAEDASPRQKRVGLNLLPLVADEHHNLASVAALLLDEEFRENARVSLEMMGTEKAAAALCAVLPLTNETFRLDILRALLACNLGDQAVLLQPLLETGTPPIQAATLRALAKTGDPALLSHARRICTAATEENAFDAWDGWLRLADAIALRGGHWELALAAYREILDIAPHPLIRGGAIVGLGRLGDTNVMPDILAVVQDENGAMFEPAALEAFRRMTGRAAHLALLEALPEINETMLPGMMHLLGDQGDPLFLDALTEHAQHADPAVRAAAQAALSKTGLPQAAAVFQSLLAGDALGEEEREAVLGYLHGMALKLRQRGDSNGAGQAYLAIYRHARTEELREAALEGIRAFPVADAFEVILEMLAEGDLDTLPISTMVGVAQNAIAAGREEEGRKLMDGIMPRLTNADAVRHAIHAMRAQGPNPDFARALGYINRWRMVGPFPWSFQKGFEENYVGEPNVSVENTYESEGKTLEWEIRESADAAALFDMTAHIGAAENVTAFAYTEVEVVEGGGAQLRIGSDDGLRVWINGEEVFQINEDRGYDIDQNVADITLQTGRNVILAQSTQILGGWAFTVRLTHPDGKPLEFTIVE